MRKEYEAPELRELGTFGDLTQGANDKIGSSPDALTPVLNLDGSIVPD